MLDSRSRLVAKAGPRIAILRYRILWREDDRVMDEVDALLGAARAQALFESPGISGSSRGQTIRDIFYGMGRIVFFTVGDDECRAWAIDKGVPAVEAAGAIHTDQIA